MMGMDRHTGRRLSGWPHVRQSVADILTTRIAARVQRRSYGSAAPELIDRPGTGEAVLRRFVAVAEALDRWEPRVDLAGFRLVSMDPDGAAVIGVDLVDRATRSRLSVEVAL